MNFPCRFDQRNRYSDNNWAHRHRVYLEEWVHRRQRLHTVQAVHDPSQYAEYLRWLHEVTRVKLKPAFHKVEIDEEVAAADFGDEYDAFTRTGSQPERAPPSDYVVRKIGRAHV